MHGRWNVAVIVVIFGFIILFKGKIIFSSILFFLIQISTSISNLNFFAFFERFFKTLGLSVIGEKPR